MQTYFHVQIWNLNSTFPYIIVPYTVKMVGVVNPALWNSVQMRSGFLPMITDAEPEHTFPGTCLMNHVKLSKVNISVLQQSISIE